jgi:hypothetical protein
LKNEIASRLWPTGRSKLLWNSERVMVDALRAYVGDAAPLVPEQRRAVRALLRLNG